MLDKRKKSVVLILLGLMMLAGLLGCSDSSDAPQETDSSSNAPEENDRIVGEVGTGAAPVSYTHLTLPTICSV